MMFCVTRAEAAEWKVRFCIVGGASAGTAGVPPGETPALSAKQTFAMAYRLKGGGLRPGATAPDTEGSSLVQASSMSMTSAWGVMAVSVANNCVSVDVAISRVAVSVHARSVIRASIIGHCRNRVCRRVVIGRTGRRIAVSRPGNIISVGGVKRCADAD